MGQKRWTLVCVSSRYAIIPVCSGLIEFVGMTGETDAYIVPFIGLSCQPNALVFERGRIGGGVGCGRWPGLAWRNELLTAFFQGLRHRLY
jgi:hypothetical protein